jgi:hypothetical protein
MGKKIIGILFVGLVLALVLPVVSAYADYDKELSAIGVIRIDQANSEIKGFVIFGDNDGEVLRLTFIKIAFDDGYAPIELGGKIPFFGHHIKYNPAD